MSARRRLPDLTLADAGRTFVMAAGSMRRLVLPSTYPERPVATGAVRIGAECDTGVDAAGTVTRYRVEALEVGTGTIAAGRATWVIEVRDRPSQSAPPEQTRDDTDAGWGERRAGHTSQWWQEQRPPHW